MRDLLTRQHRCLHRSGLHDPKNFAPDRFVHGNTAKGDALRLALIQPSTHGGVAQEAVLGARVVHHA
jgi:hypothetical protein